MRDHELTIKIVGLDKATGVIGSVNKSVGKFAKMGQAAFLGIAVAGAAATAAVVGTVAAIGIKAVQAGADAEEMMSKLASTFGESANAMLSDLDAFARATGRSRFELRGAATDLGAVLKAMGFTEQAAADLSAETVQLAVDLAAFNNLETEDVANRIQRAYTGEFESLKMLGIVINETMLKQEYATMGLSTATGAVTAQQKALAVQAIMLRQTADAQGAAARETMSFTGRMVALKSTVKDFITQLGMKLLPVVTPLLEKFTLLAEELLPVIAEWLEDEVIPQFEALMEPIGELAEEIIPDLVYWLQERLLPTIGRLIRAFGEFVRGNYGAAFETLFPPVVAEKLTAIVDLFVRFKDIIVEFVSTHAENFKAAILAIGTALLVAGIATTITQIISALSRLVLGTGPLAILIALVGLLGVAWRNNWLGIRDITKKVIDWLVGFWESTLKPAIDKIKIWYEEHLRPAIEKVGEAIQKFWTDTVQPAIEEAWGAVEAYWTGTMRPGLEGIRDRIIEIYGEVQTALETGDFAAAFEALGVPENIAELLANLTVAIGNLAVAMKDLAISASPIERIGLALGGMVALKGFPPFVARMREFSKLRPNMSFWEKFSKSLAGVAPMADAMAATIEWGRELAPSAEGAGEAAEEATSNFARLDQYFASMPGKLGPLFAKVHGYTLSASLAVGSFATDVTTAAGPIDTLKAFLAPVGTFFKGIGTAVAGAFTGATTAISGFFTALTPLLPLLAIIAALVVAVVLLRTAWVNNFGGIQDKVKGVIAFLVGIWQNTLLPALKAGAAWIQDHVVPVFAAVANVVDAVLGLALTVLAGIWENVVRPALETAWGVFQDIGAWLSETFGPILQSLIDFLEDIFGPVWKWLKDKIIDPVIEAFGKVGEILDKVSGWLHDLAEKIRNLELPDWLTPGSATPFEIGLWGIVEAITTLNDLDMPGFMGEGDFPISETPWGRRTDEYGEVYALFEDIGDSRRAVITLRAMGDLIQKFDKMDPQKIQLLAALVD